MLLFMILRFFFHFDKIMSYAVILYLSGKNSGCFLLIVVPLTGVCLFIVLWFVFHNWVYWTRGNLLASRVMTYRRLCVSAAWSAGLVRVYLVALLGWVAGRYGFPVLLALFWRVFA